MSNVQSPASESKTKCNSEVIAYKAAAGVKWVVEQNGIILSNGNGGIHRLGYPEAAIWDLISRGYSANEVTSMLIFIGSLESKCAETQLLNSLENWVKLGLLKKRKNRG